MSEIDAVLLFAAVAIAFLGGVMVGFEVRDRVSTWRVLRQLEIINKNLLLGNEIAAAGRRWRLVPSEKAKRDKPRRIRRAS